MSVRAGHVHTAVFTMDRWRGPIAEPGELCSAWRGSLGGRGVWGRMDTRIRMAGALCFSPETVTTLLICYTPTRNKKLKHLFSFWNHWKTGWNSPSLTQRRARTGSVLCTLGRLVITSEVLPGEQKQKEPWWRCSWVCMVALCFACQRVRPSREEREPQNHSRWNPWDLGN